MTRTTMPTAVALTATAVLLLTACSGSGDDSSDQIAGASAGSSKSASPSASTSVTIDRPKIELPSDLTYSFTPEKTGDAVKDAVLYDNEQFMKAADMAIVRNAPLDKAYQFYSTGKVASDTQAQVQRFVDHKARITGTYRFYKRSVTINKDGTAAISFCEDQSKAYNKYLETGRVDVTPVTKNSYVSYGGLMRKNSKGIWITEQMISTRGADKCQP